MTTPLPPSRTARRRRRHQRPRTPRLARTLAVGVAVMIVMALGVGLLRMFETRQQESPLPRVASESQSGTVGLLDQITVSGRVGATPVVSVTAPVVVTGTKRLVVTKGKGRQITADSPVVIAVTAFDGRDGTVLSPGGLPQLTVGPANTAGIGEDLTRAVIGHTEGSRLLYARSLAPTGSAESAGKPPVEIDIVDILPSVATGAPASQATSTPLEVTLGNEGPVIRHGQEVPTDLVVQPLLEGNGAQIGARDRVVAQFIVTGWSDGKVRDSTWSTGLPKAVDMTHVMPGLQRALVDQRIGSRLAVTIPPDLASGDDTLCVVIDLLGAQSPPPADDAPASGGAPAPTAGKSRQKQ